MSKDGPSATGVGPQGAVSLRDPAAAEVPPRTPASVREPRLSLLLQLRDEPGALLPVLNVFAAHGVNLTQIESRPAQDERFDFYVNCAGERGQADVEQAIDALGALTDRLMVLDHREVPWFPRHASELDRMAANVLDAGTDLTADHPGFHDRAYRERRAHIDQLAREHRYGDPVPLVSYTAAEQDTWRQVYARLHDLHLRYACREYLHIAEELRRHTGFGGAEIPQARAVSDYLQSVTGFRLRPVAGLLSSRDFLNALAFRVFFSTQYIRHHSKPLYTPEPDICHELIGHAPMFADPAFADFSQEIGLASLGASDAEIERLARCYWHSVEFGLVEEEGARKAYGAGLLSSFGELAHACARPSPADSGPEFQPWDPAAAAVQDYPITDYQPLYFVATSLRDARAQMRSYCESRPRPFYARHNPVTGAIWVDRAVRRQ
ncbi:MAG: ACT domain-containing protein [Pseudomonadota bacterium]